MRKTRIVPLLTGVLLTGGLIMLTAVHSRMEARPRPSAASNSAPIPAADPQARANSVSVDSTDIGGVVTSSKGPEAGVWVIADTNDLPTKYRKIVVTDDLGRYLIPDLPKAT